MIQSQRIRAANGEWRYTGELEVICYDCGDDPALGYTTVSPLLRRLRGPYRTVDQARAALERHCGRNTWRARHL
jgi:hypothetical protein